MHKRNTKKILSRGQNKKDFTGSFRKSDKFGKFRATFNQQISLFKALTWLIQLCKLKDSSILSYSKVQEEGVRRESKKERKPEET